MGTGPSGRRQWGCAHCKGKSGRELGFGVGGMAWMGQIKSLVLDMVTLSEMWLDVQSPEERPVQTERQESQPLLGQTYSSGRGESRKGSMFRLSLGDQVEGETHGFTGSPDEVPPLLRTPQWLPTAQGQSSKAFA